MFVSRVKAGRKPGNVTRRHPYRHIAEPAWIVAEPRRAITAGCTNSSLVEQRTLMEDSSTLPSRSTMNSIHTTPPMY